MIRLHKRVFIQELTVGYLVVLWEDFWEAKSQKALSVLVSLRFCGSSV